jgi:hypothetical protein
MHTEIRGQRGKIIGAGAGQLPACENANGSTCYRARVKTKTAYPELVLAADARGLSGGGAKANIFVLIRLGEIITAFVSSSVGPNKEDFISSVRSNEIIFRSSLSLSVSLPLRFLRRMERARGEENLDADEAAGFEEVSDEECDIIKQ